MFSTGSTTVEGSSDIVAFAADDKRHRFLSYVYLHLAAATLATIFIVGVLLRLATETALQYQLLQFEHSVIVVSIIATAAITAATRVWAVRRHESSIGRQYAVLCLAVSGIAFAIWPAMQLAEIHEANLPRNLAVMSGIVIGGLALSHFFAGQRLPWHVRYAITLLLTAVAMLFVLTIFGRSMSPQLWLPAAMIAAAATAIQYEITNVVHACCIDEYVKAAVVLCGFGTLLALLTLPWMLAAF